MLKRTWIARLAAAAGCATLLTMPARAEDEAPRNIVRRMILLGGPAQPLLIAQQQAEENAPRGDRRGPSEYWLGLECVPLDAVLRTHLGLAEGEALLIEQVVPDSPAAKADLKRYDVIVSAGEKPIKSLVDLVKAVDDAKDNELTLEIIRGGKPTTVKTTPAKRPESPDVLRRVPGRRLDDMRAWIERLERGEQPGDMRYRIFGPGAVLPGGERNLPKGMTVSITRSGDEPAKITVKKGKETWEVTEKELDKLPDDVRPHIERMLGRGVLALPGAPPLPGALPLPGAPPAVAPPARRPSAAVDMQLMRDQLETLRKQVEELQKTLSPPSKSSPNEET